MSNWPATTWIAVYAAVVSSLTASWSIWVGLRDRARLRVDVSLARFGDDPSRPRKFLLTVTNVGRRPISVATWGGAFRKATEDGYEEFRMRPNNMPRELKEYQQVSEFADYPGVLFARPVRDIWVHDTAGRKWKVPRRQLRSLEKRSTVVIEQGAPGPEEDAG